MLAQRQPPPRRQRAPSCREEVVSCEVLFRNLRPPKGGIAPLDPRAPSADIRAQPSCLRDWERFALRESSLSVGLTAVALRHCHATFVHLSQALMVKH